MLWHRETHIDPQRNRYIIVDPAGIELTTSPDRGNSASCQLSSTYASRHWNCVKKRNSNDMPEAALDNWQRVWNAQVSNSTPMCVNFELRPGAGDIHIYIHTYIHACIHTYIYTYIFVVVNFDALAQASDFRIERRHVVFLSWKQDSNPEGLWNPISSRLNACWQTDWAVEDQAKAWTRQAVPMISKHSAHLTPLPFGICTWLWRYTYLLLLISMLWHRQAIFKSKGDTYIQTYIFVVVNFDALAQASDIRIQRRQVVFLCWRQDSNPEGLRHLFASRLNACWQTDWAIEDQAKNLNSTARPYDQQAYSPPDPAAIWHLHLALAIYIFVVVHFDALAQASDIRIERRQVVFLGWRQDSNPEGLRHLFASRRNACWQTDWAIEDQAKNLISTARPYDQQAFSPSDPTAIWHSHIHTYMFVVVNFDALY